MNTRKGSDKPTVGEADVLARADQFTSALRETHSSIPAALAEELQLSGAWGSAAISGGDIGQLHARLASARERRELDVRRRSAAVEGLLELESELTQARAVADSERVQLAGSVVSEFMSRWNLACRTLAQLHSEAAALSVTLHSRVDCPAPYMASTNVVSGQPEVKLALPIAPPPLALPPALATVAAALDRLDGVLAVIAGIKQARQFDSRHYQLAVNRGAATEHTGTFRVISEFVCAGDGLPFKPGELIDSSLVGNGHLQRLQMGKRYVVPVELEMAAA